jgi:hypothetical protein
MALSACPSLSNVRDRPALNMRPRFFINNVADCATTNSKLKTKRRASVNATAPDVPGPNTLDLAGRKNGVSVTPSIKHIAQVICLSPYLKVVRINAARIVTGMPNYFTVYFI